MAVKVAVIGHGVVGSGVAEILLSQTDCIEKQAGQALELAYILDIRSFPELPYAEKFVPSIEPILQDQEVKVVAECIGGATIAFELVSACLKAGKSVCTSNKELIATRGNELFALAEENGVHILYEACVGGGIPVLRPLQTCFGANHILSINGILNGTTNYILTQMKENGLSMPEALKQAQQNGYAEANPTADMEGYDAARKISILASMACGEYVNPALVPTRGISSVTEEDIAYAAKMGCKLKLVGRYEQREDGVQVSVSPCFVMESRLLSHVDGVQNAICVVGDKVGETLFYGPGAGKNPTASAVVSDLIALTNLSPVENHLTWSATPAKLSEKEAPACYYLRTIGEDSISGFMNFDHKECLGQTANQGCAALLVGTTESEIQKAFPKEKIGLIAKILS